MITRQTGNFGKKPHNYFEGILQLRNPTQDMVDWVKEQIAKDKRAWIAKEEEVTNGIDLYLSSQHYLRALGKVLKQKFVGELKVTATLHTISKSTGKELYRVTVLFRFLGVKIGDLVTVSGEQFKLLRVDNQVQLKNVATGKKVWKKIEVLRRPA